jgi:CarboxypepD_reg-like domain/Secretion system C-terminal sorting domain
MKQKLQLQIPEPCHENWNKMTATQQGRFCMSCQKEVVDFSVMTDKEILNYISRAGEKMCGRVQEDQLNRFIQVPRERKQHSFKYFWSLVITSFLISYKSSGQVKIPKDKIVCGPTELPPALQGKVAVRIGGISTISTGNAPALQISGKVVDENNNPVSYASVMIKGTKAGVATDAEGSFLLEAKRDLKNMELIFSSVGYTMKTLEVDRPDQIKSISVENKAIKINVGVISLKAQLMGEVVIIPNSYSTGKVIVGGLSFKRRYTVIEKAKNKFNEITGRNEVKIYPNPVPLNSHFNIGFNLKTQGEYSIQFADAAGRVILSRLVNIVSTSQVESFSSNGFLVAGVYFITVKNNHNNKVYTTKLVMQ